MSLAAKILLGALTALALFYVYRWFAIERSRARAGESRAPGLVHPAVGFVTNFFDTLGVGSFAPTTSMFKLLKLVPDEKIPGTLNAGHALPTVAQALIFIAVVSVDPTTLVGMIAAAVLGAWLGAGVGRAAAARRDPGRHGRRAARGGHRCSCSATWKRFPPVAMRWPCVARCWPSPSA